jgi:hypothetical protein
MCGISQGDLEVPEKLEELSSDFAIPLIER